MQVVRFDHKIDAVISDPAISEVVQSAVDALSTVPTPYWRGKSEKQATKCVLQPVLNSFIEQELFARGWGGELRVTGGEDGVVGMRIDFHRIVGEKLVAMEVQLGNVGRFYSDVFKFMHLQSIGRLALAIHVSLTADTAQLTDSGLSTHENTRQRLSEVENSIFRLIPVPMVCLGLSHVGASALDFATSRFPEPRLLSGAGAKTSIKHAVELLRQGVAIEDVGPPDILKPALKDKTTEAQTDLFAELLGV